MNWKDALEYERCLVMREHITERLNRQAIMHGPKDYKKKGMGLCDVWDDVGVLSPMDKEMVLALSSRMRVIEIRFRKEETKVLFRGLNMLLDQEDRGR